MLINKPLDVAFGGQFPDGKVIEVYGDSESAKTLLALAFAKAYGSDGKETLYVDVNGGLTNENLVNAGVKNTTWARPENAEEAFEIIKIMSENIDLLVVDTVSGLSSKHETAAQSYRATVNKALRRVMSIAKDNICYKNGGTILILNQMYQGNHGETTHANKSLSQYVDIRMETKTIFKRPANHLIGLTVTRSSDMPLFMDFRMMIHPGDWYHDGESMHYLLSTKKISRSAGKGIKLKKGYDLAGKSSWDTQEEAVEYYESVPTRDWMKLFKSFYGEGSYYQ